MPWGEIADRDGFDLTGAGIDDEERVPARFEGHLAWEIVRPESAEDRGLVCYRGSRADDGQV